MIKIDKGIKPVPKKTKFNFEEMKVGDTFYYEGTKSVPITNLGYRLIKGKYKVEREGKGWRFYLLKSIKPLLLESKKKPSKYNFDEMKVGDSFHYGGSRVSAITALASRIATGRYKISVHKNGWLFELTQPIQEYL